ncbi:MAG: type I restriction-modification enzyme R subunit C-terminal domain-containing protein [Erysipelotrichaceae bacterium]|nr:type I restriction-modification enzyme R subunit C-terminal domain-containing protein [Erysipelotrichaceae bacterium]
MYYRKSVRHLMIYLLEEKIVAVTIDNDDQTQDGDNVDTPFIDIRTYKEKVMDYLMENSNNPTLVKIKNLEPLTHEDFEALQDILWVKCGSKNDYYSISKLDNLAVFIRSIIGIDQNAVNEKFSEYLDENTLSAEQMEFIHSIINYARENGDVTKQDLVEESPFDSINVLDLFSENAYVVANVVNQLHDCILEV